MKTSGRDAGSKCVIIEKIDSNFVMIDGETRRRKCNIMHLEPLDKKLDIKKGESHTNVLKAFKKINIEITEKKPKTKKTERPRRIRKSSKKIKREVEKKTVKKIFKKKVETKKVVKKITKKILKKK